LATVDQTDIRGSEPQDLIRRGAAFLYVTGVAWMRPKAGTRVPRTFCSPWAVLACSFRFKFCCLSKIGGSSPAVVSPSPFGLHSLLRPDGGGETQGRAAPAVV